MTLPLVTASLSLGLTAGTRHRAEMYLFGALGKNPMIAHLIARRWLVSLLIHKEFRACPPLLVRGILLQFTRITNRDEDPQCSDTVGAFASQTAGISLRFDLSSAPIVLRYAP
jgi:hypothetical protein